MRALVPALLAALLAGCNAPLPALVAVGLPAMDGHEQAVQGAVAKAIADAEALRQLAADPAALSAAYGELAMLCHMAQFVPCAIQAYANARQLEPEVLRWPYLLGHLHNDNAQPRPAAQAFEAALAIDPDDAPTLLSLGEVLLTLADPDRAEALFTKLLAKPAARAAGLAGLGRVAMARHEPERAVERFEEALRLSPTSARLRYPLATAYRELGQSAKAHETLRAYAAHGADPSLPDPHVDALGRRVRSSRGLMRRGQRYAQAGRPDLALPAFRAAAQANPADAEILTNLGVTLVNLDQLAQAKDVLERALTLDAASGAAHFALGVVHDRSLRDDNAAAEYEAALKAEPANARALLYLADTRMRTGRADDAARLYREAIERDPSPRVQMALVMAEVKRGRDREAKAELERGLLRAPQYQAMANALARLLAASRQPEVRDGKRALQIASDLLRAPHNDEVAQTYAMALAETGDFEGAVAVQQRLLGAQGEPVSKAFIEANLELYRARRPCREPWAAADPIFAPRSSGHTAR